MKIPHEIEHAFYGFMHSHVLFVGDELGIFSCLAGGGSHTAERLSDLTGAKSEPMERFLIAATSLGFIGPAEGTSEGGQTSYEMPEHLRPFFQKSSPLYCGGMFPHFRENSTAVFRFLKEGLMEGEPQWKRVFGVDNQEDQFESIYSDQNRLRDFVASMWSLSFDDETNLLKQFSLRDYHHLVDIGGCGGSFAINALQENPTLNATIFDLPEVQSFSLKKRKEYQLEDRLTFCPGNFFADPLPKADVFSLGYILSDWGRDEGTAILKKIYHALPNGGAVLILEKLFNEQHSGPMVTAMMNLCMLLEQKGKHYSASEYFSWLQEVGFNHCQVVRSTGDKHMIIGVK